MTAAPEENKPAFKILLAEDNEMNRELATRLLKRRGHEVVAVANGQQALETYQKESFDVILMDVEMPVMDGLEATRQIRSLEKTGAGARTPAHIPIIAMTAYDQQEMHHQIEKAGLDGLINKPISTRELDPTLRGIVQKVRSEFP